MMTMLEEKYIQINKESDRLKDTTFSVQKANFESFNI